MLCLFRKINKNLSILEVSREPISFPDTKSHVITAFRFFSLFNYMSMNEYSTATKKAEDNGPTRRDPACLELVSDGEQYVIRNIHYELNCLVIFVSLSFI